MNDEHEMLHVVNCMLDNMELMKRQVELNSVLTKVAYESLMKVGFTKREAMEFIKARGPMLS